MGQAAEIKENSEIADGMRIQWNTPIPMDDGIALRADIFRPLAEGRYPVIMNHGPTARIFPSRRASSSNELRSSYLLLPVIPGRG